MKATRFPESKLSIKLLETWSSGLSQSFSHPRLLIRVILATVPSFLIVMRFLPVYDFGKRSALA